MFSLVWMSCDQMFEDVPGYARIAARRPSVVVHQGDLHYSDTPTSNLFGAGSQPAFSDATDATAAASKLAQALSKPQLQQVLSLRNSGTLLYYQPDDHEWADNDWDHDLRPDAGLTTQALVNAHWDIVNQTIISALATHFDNPTPDAGGNTERPSGALRDGQNPATTKYPIKYFYRDFSFSGRLGGADIRVIVLDELSYRSPVAETDGVDKRMLGAQQEAWLESLLNASGAFSNVLVMSNKKLWRGFPGLENTDLYEYYATERDRILAMMHASPCRVIWLSGDRHTPQVSQASVADGDPGDIIDICACPIGVLINPGNAHNSHMHWMDRRRGYGLVTADGTHLRIAFRDAVTDSELWAARFAPRSNAPIYPSPPAVTRVA